MKHTCLHDQFKLMLKQLNSINNFEILLEYFLRLAASISNNSVSKIYIIEKIDEKGLKS